MSTPEDARESLRRNDPLWGAVYDAAHPDTPRPPMTQSEPVLEPSRGSICVCGLAKSYHGPPTNLADSDHEYEPRYPARRATQSPVQPVLSGLGALEREWLDSTPPAGHPLIHGIFQRLPDRLAPLLDAARAAQSPVQPVPPNHPDDGHAHSWGCRRCGVDPVQPVLSGLDRLATQLQETGTATVHWGDEQAALAALRAIGAESFTVSLAATAPAADEGHVHGREFDSFHTPHRRSTAATAPAADEGPYGGRPPAERPVLFWRGASERNEGQLLAGILVSPAEFADSYNAASYNAAISDAQQVLQDMPGISDNDVTPPREMPDYIERAEAVAEVEKLRR